jgi:hypothetical protein
MLKIYFFFCYRIYPLLLELAVESTYPLDESLVMALISMLSAVQGVFIIEIRSVFAKPLETQVEVNIWRKVIRHASLESIVFSLIDTNMYFLVLGIQKHLLLTTLLKIEYNKFKIFGYRTVS